MGELRFRNRPTPTPEALAVERRRAWWLVGLTVLVGGALVARSQLPVTPAPDTVLVEVTGEVPRPGWQRLEVGTLMAAVEAAGGASAGLPETPVADGDRVVVAVDGVHVEPGADPLLVAVPLDVNTAGAAVLATLPGVGERTAQALVTERQEHGPYYALDELTRAPGVGGSTVEALRPLLTIGDPGPRPEVARVSVNQANAAQLQRVPGIGPSLAARILEDRERNGPFAGVDDLQRVKGVGPVLVARAAAFLE